MDVGHVNAGGVGCACRSVDVEVACVEDDWPVGVVIVEILEGDVVNVTIPNIWTSP